jgi:hypothetical protein
MIGVKCSKDGIYIYEYLNKRKAVDVCGYSKQNLSSTSKYLHAPVAKKMTCHSGVQKEANANRPS